MTRERRAKTRTQPHVSGARRLDLQLGCVRDLEATPGADLPRGAGGRLDLRALLGPDAERARPLVDAWEQARESGPEALEGCRLAFVRAYEMAGDNVSSAFTTGNGYVGRSNHTTREGDEVAVLFGASMPVVLRRQDAGFEFLGPCYVSGVMFGELMDGRSPELEVQKIPLV